MSLTRRFHENELARLLEERGVLVADGGIGTILLSLGLDAGTPPELWNAGRPDEITAVHQAYVEAGADILLTNTFGANRLRLAHRGLATRTEELNSAAAVIARTVTNAAERPIIVAGSIGPTGSLFAPLGSLEADEAVSVFTHQMTALANSKVDVLWIETMSSIDELSAAHAAASEFDLPVVSTMSFDTNGHTMMGTSPTDLAAWWDAQDPRPAAVGANCGIGPDETVAAVAQITGATNDAVVVAKGNCGLPVWEGADIRYPIGPDGMVDYTERNLEAGARIIGACCGSTPEHISVIRKTVDRIRAET